MPILLCLVFEELDANFRIVSFVCGCLERDGNRVVLCFYGHKEVYVELELMKGKVHRKNFYMPLPLI